MKNKILLLVATLINTIQFAQNIDVSFVTDDCLNILPKAGIYTLDGQENGKNKYIFGSNLKIVWSNTNNRWELQEYFNDTWETSFYNEKDATTPPTNCWYSDFCSNLPTMSGSDAFPMVNFNSQPTILITSETSSTVTYTVTFDNTLNNLSSSNFSLPTTGGIITNIASVTQDLVDQKKWYIVINWSGEGSLQLNLTNDTGTSALIGCGGEIRGQHYNTFIADDSLDPGDIAFTGYNSFNYATSPPFSADFSFIVLKNGGLPAGTELFFTDNGFNNNTSLLTAIEGTFILRFNNPVNQYDQIRVTIPLISTDPYGVFLPSGTATTYKIGTNISLQQNGDQIFIYQGTTKNPKFVTGIHMNTETSSSLTAWDNYSGTALVTKSALPSELTNGVNAVMVVNEETPSPTYKEFDGAIFNCVGSDTSLLTTTNINDRTKWIKKNSVNIPLLATCETLDNNNFEFANKITIFPNPANSILNINFNEITPFTASLIDFNGRTLKTSKLIYPNNALDISELAKGIYILQILTREGTLNKQIIKE